MHIILNTRISANEVVEIKPELSFFLSRSSNSHMISRHMTDIHIYVYHTFSYSSVSNVGPASTPDEVNMTMITTNLITTYFNGSSLNSINIGFHFWKFAPNFKRIGSQMLTRSFSNVMTMTV